MPKCAYCWVDLLCVLVLPLSFTASASIWLQECTFLHPPCYSTGICNFWAILNTKLENCLSKGQGRFVREKEPSEPRVGEWAEPKLEEPQEILTLLECDEVLTVQSPLVL